MANNSMFSVVIEYPRKIELGSVVIFEGKRLEVKKLTSIEPVTEKLFLINGLGKIR